MRLTIILAVLLTSFTACKNNSEKQSGQENDTIENVPEENVRPTGDMRSVPSESAPDSLPADSIK
jgi:hypothetical protein